MNGGGCRVVALDAAAPVNNLKVLTMESVPNEGGKPVMLKLKPWDIRWTEFE